MRVYRLTLIRGERRDVDEPCHLRVCAGFGDDGTAVGMTNQHNRPLRPSDREPRGGNIVGQRYRRILHDTDVVAVLLQVVAFLKCCRRFPNQRHRQNRRGQERLWVMLNLQP